MSSQEFSFLIVTDIHDNIENTKKLVEEVKDKKFDYNTSKVTELITQSLFAFFLIFKHE